MNSAPDIARVNRARWGLRVTFFFMGMAVAATSARFAEIKSQTHASDTAFGLSIMLGNIGAIVGNLYGRRIATYMGTRTMAKVVMFGVGGAQVAYGFANHLWQLPLIAFAAGMTYSLANVACNTQGSMIQEYTGRSLMPSFHGAWSVGALTASLVAGSVAKFLTPAVHISINIFLALVGIVAINNALLPKSVDDLDTKKNAAVQNDEPIPQHIKNFLYLVSLGSLLATIGEVSVGDWSSILLKEDLHVGIGFNTLGYSSFVIAQVIGRFSVGRIIDKVGIPKVIRIGGLVGGAGYAAGLIISHLVVHHSKWQALIVMCIAYAILGFGVSPMPPSYVSVAGSIPGVPTARALSRMAVTAAAGFFIGRGLVSLLAGLIGLPLALLVPAFALMGSGFLAHTLHLDRITKESTGEK